MSKSILPYLLAWLAAAALAFAFALAGPDDTSLMGANSSPELGVNVGSTA